MFVITENIMKGPVYIVQYATIYIYIYRHTHTHTHIYRRVFDKRLYIHMCSVSDSY